MVSIRSYAMRPSRDSSSSCWWDMHVSIRSYAMRPSRGARDRPRLSSGGAGVSIRALLTLVWVVGRRGRCRGGLKRGWVGSA